MATGAFVAYYRVSTAKQGEERLGLEAQRSAVESYLDGGRWRIAAEFTKIESGRRSDRPQLDAALRAARARRCPLVVAKVDRLTRSVAFLSRLLEAGVDACALRTCRQSKALQVASCSLRWRPSRGT